VLQALQQGAGAVALAQLSALPADARRHPELLRLQGLGRMQAGDTAGALEALRAAAAAWPDDALVACQLGVVQAQAGDIAAAETCFARAVELDPDLADGWHNLGLARDARADTAGACAAFAEVLRLQPENAAARVQYATMLKMLGRLAEAERALRRVLADDPDSVAAWVGLARLKGFHPSPGELQQALALERSGRVPAAQRADLALAIAALLERSGRFAEAFHRFTVANAERRRNLDWSAGAVSALVDDILERFARLPDAPVGRRGAGALFLVGMPRSGSTLAEQILSAHPAVQGGGEREEILAVLQDESRRRGRRFPGWVEDATADDWARLGEDYLERCGHWRDARPLFSNKTLANWLALGAIRRMLPGSRIVHCQRDPLETLWSCYKHAFAEGQRFSYDMDDLVAFWRDCERAMAAWKSAWPDWIHGLVHERLLDDPVGEITALLAACGLEFHPACLEFHTNARDVRTSSASQVRQPLRRDLAIAARYGDLLAPLRERIHAAAAGR
jgi:tetratricopeptide (TPR) repeat protein